MKIYTLPALFVSIFLYTFSMAQTSTDQHQLPYYNIPDYPSEYSANTVAARVIDGLGFRYFWATEGLTEKDLQYKPSDEARTTRETLEHIFGLTNVVKNASFNEINRGEDVSQLSFPELRMRTLDNIAQASSSF